MAHTTFHVINFSCNSSIRKAAILHHSQLNSVYKYMMISH